MFIECPSTNILGAPAILVAMTVIISTLGRHGKEFMDCIKQA